MYVCTVCRVCNQTLWFDEHVDIVPCVDGGLHPAGVAAADDLDGLRRDDDNQRHELRPQQPHEGDPLPDHLREHQVQVQVLDRYFRTTVQQSHGLHYVRAALIVIVKGAD